MGGVGVGGLYTADASSPGDNAARPLGGLDSRATLHPCTTLDAAASLDGGLVNRQQQQQQLLLLDQPSPANLSTEDDDDGFSEKNRSLLFVILCNIGHLLCNSLEISHSVFCNIFIIGHFCKIHFKYAIM